MDIYFVTHRPESLTKNDMATNFLDAARAYKKMNDECPAYLLVGRIEDDGHCHLYDTDGDVSFDAKWFDCGIRYFVVRHNPGTKYPETVISKDGVFNNPWDADKYIEEHGGDWKLYDFNELCHKIIESHYIIEGLKEEADYEGPF